MVRRRLDSNNDVTSSRNDVSPNILITVLVLAIAVILSASLYLLLRFLRRTSSTTTTTTTATSSNNNRHVSSKRVTPTTNNPLIDALPLFHFDALKSNGDCAVCLSKFEQSDLLRLLPICCHVFHADCIDTWLISNQSCPLCRSPVFVPESELISKLNDQQHQPSFSLSSSNNGSFRIEIGNVSQRNNDRTNNTDETRSYSLGGNFEYIVDDDAISEIHSGSFRRNSFTSEFKNDVEQQQQQQCNLAAEVGTRGGGGGGGGGWLKDYLTSSFRGSGRWFTGSSRRETTEFGGESRVSELDLEASRLGDEIGELFRWLSGV